MLKLAGDVLVLVAAAAGGVGVAAYGLSARWWRSWPGRSLMLLGFALAASDTAVSLALWLGPDFPGRLWVRLVLFGISASAAVTFLVTVVTTQIRRRRTELEEEVAR